jgi:D-beta-D-heptose 7-phosphate kinase/D-beta-D-heptose 1-phosphate adenosyltransferase
MMLKIIVNGTFDIIHRGHLHLLEYARSHLDSFVYVLIDSDKRVNQLKGLDRPVNNQNDRKFLLESLQYVDRVDIFDSDDELRYLISSYKPDLMIKGSDYEGKPIIGSEFCKEIKFYAHTGHSTTRFIQRITDR